MINLASTFNSLAKYLECDEDKERFEEKLGKIAKARKGVSENSNER